jgi:hypothetical protein
VDRTGIKHETDEKFLQGFDLRIRRKKTAWVNLGIAGRIMLKLAPKKLNLKLMDWVYFAYNVNQ